MSKKMTKQDFHNYIISEAKKLYKIEVLKEQKNNIDKELKMLNESGGHASFGSLGFLGGNKEKKEIPKNQNLIPVKISTLSKGDTFRLSNALDNSSILTFNRVEKKRDGYDFELGHLYRDNFISYYNDSIGTVNELPGETIVWIEK